MCAWLGWQDGLRQERYGKSRMKKKKLMILGAGIYQVPIIKKAKELGLFTIVVSYRGNYPGFELADTCYYIDTTDEDKVLEVARQENIDGICTSGSDVALISLGRVCSELNLCGLSYSAAQYSTNKSKMKDAFIAHNVRTAKHYTVSSREELQERFEQLQKPVILKVVDSSGSRGIIRVDSADGIDTAYEKIMRITKLDYFIIEEFLEGEEFGAQAFVFNGEIKFVMAHGDMMFHGDAGVPIGHYVPHELDQDVLRDLIRQLENSVNALGFDNCAVNADFMLCNQKVYVLEIGGRAGATCLPEMTSIYYGIDYYRMLVESALGTEPRIVFNERNACAGELIISHASGNITGMDNSNQQDDFIVDLSFDCQLGDPVSKFAVGPDRIGQIVVTGTDHHDALNNLEKVKERISIEVD